MNRSSNNKITKQGFADLKKELKKRKSVIKKQLQDQLNDELSRGDISENASYYTVQEEIGSNDKRIAELEDFINNAVVVDNNKSSKTTISVGSTVVLKSESVDLTFSIVGATETDPAKKKISIESPMGKSLCGKKEGDTVIVRSPEHDIEYTIVKIQ
ncbi:MAG: transcription elongation factor GreA [Patescibacteria group bacterium]|nr:transcription elongation factor GreA [Patescibacteria group bacterium]